MDEYFTDDYFMDEYVMDFGTINPEQLSRSPKNDQDQASSEPTLKYTQLMSQCCECGGLKLYAVGLPCIVRSNPLCHESNTSGISEHRKWELCLDCGPAACNKILGIQHGPDGIELYLLRCCLCRIENICGNGLCAECGDAGCCQCHLVHQITEAHWSNLGRVIASVQKKIDTPTRRHPVPSLLYRDFLPHSSKRDFESPSVVEIETGPLLVATPFQDIAHFKSALYPYISSSASQIYPGSMDRRQTDAQAAAAARRRRHMHTQSMLLQARNSRKPIKPPIKKNVMINGFENPDPIRKRELDQEMAEFKSPVANLSQLMRPDSSEMLESPAIPEPTFDNESHEEEFLRMFGPFSSDNQRELHVSREGLLQYAEPLVCITGDLGTTEPAQASTSEQREATRDLKRKHIDNHQPPESESSSTLGDFESSRAFPQPYPSKKTRWSSTTPAIPAASVGLETDEEPLTMNSNPSFDSYNFNHLSRPSPELQAQSDAAAPVSTEADIETVPLENIENNLPRFPKMRYP